MTALDRRQFCASLAAAGAMMTAAGPIAAQGPMIRRPIPASGERLPVVGVGTWQTFDVGRDPADRAQLAEVLRILFAAGGSVIDSSPMYGRAEEVVGDLLAAAGTRGEAFLATKVWTEGAAAGRAQIAESFRLLRAKTIDLLQVHNLVDWRTQLASLREMKQAGRIRYLGLTHYTTAAFGELEDILRTEPVDFLQIPYSIAVRRAEDRILGVAAQRGVAVIANRPFDGGNLFAKTRGRPLPGFAADIDCASWAQFFLKYLLGHPAMTCVIPGTARPRYMADNVGAGRGGLPDAATRARMVAVIEAL